MTTLILLCVLAYLVGSIPTGKILARYKGVDIQAVGTGNIGASNTYAMVGKRAGFLVLLGDMGKAYVMMEIALAMRGIGEAALVGLFLLIGNTRSIFLNFKGGKGIATSLGIFIAVEPIVAIVMVTFWGIGLFFLKYILVSGIIGSLLIPLTFYRYEHDLLTMACSFIMCLIILFSHKTNIELRDKPEVQKPV